MQPDAASGERRAARAAGEPASRRPRRPHAQTRAALLRVCAVLLLAYLLGATLAVLPPSRLVGRTLLLLPAFFVQLPVDPQTWLTPPVRHSQLQLEANGETAILHVYAPAQGRHPALVISLGVDPAPPDDPRVVRLFDGLARSGLVAVLVQSPALDASRIEPGAPDLLAHAFTTVARLPAVEPRRVGLFGFSVGGSLALLAAAQPSTGRQVRLVEAFGAYDSLITLTRAAVTHSISVNGHAEPWQPDPITVNILRLNLINTLPAARDRELLTRAFAQPSVPAAPPAGLSAASRTIFSLLTAPSGAQFDAALAALPAATRAQLDALSPASQLHNIRAPVYLLVDVSDTLVPPTESRAIAAGLAQAGVPVHFTPLDIFRHVDPTRGGNPFVVLRDLARLYLHAYAVLHRLEQ